MYFTCNGVLGDKTHYSKSVDKFSFCIEIGHYIDDPVIFSYDYRI